MPTISMFYGIIIRMYYAPGEHSPPHFHAYEPLAKLFRSWFDKLTMNEISMSYQAEVRSP